MTAFGSLRCISIDSCKREESVDTFGLKTCMNKNEHVDSETKLHWTILSVSVENDGCFFVEFLFAAVLDKQEPRRLCFSSVRDLLSRVCCRRREERSRTQAVNNMHLQRLMDCRVGVLRKVVECPCNFIVVNSSVAERSQAIMQKASISCRVWPSLGDCSGEALFGKRKNHAQQQQQQQQQEAAAAPCLSLLDKEQQQEQSAVSQRQLLQLRAQQAYELSACRQRSQQQSSSGQQQQNTKAFTPLSLRKASYPLGSTQATESEEWHTLHVD
ncbi:hypothetical protein Efla_000185 [Eimeria flavescens]